MNLILTVRFARHLRSQLAWIADKSPSGAERVRTRVFHSIAVLRANPQIGRVGKVEGTRELIVPRTRLTIVYRLANGAIEVAALIHQSQQWPEEL